MRRFLVVVLLPLACTALASCLNTEILLHLRADGSGTIRVRETRLFGSPLMGPMPDKDDQAVMPLSLHAFHGEIRIVDSRTSRTATSVTRTTTAEFDDVTTLVLPFPPILNLGWSGSGQANPADMMPAGVAPMPEIPEMRFSLKDHGDGDRLLTIAIPWKEMPVERDDAEPAPAGTSEPGGIGEDVRAMAKGAGARFLIELESPVLRTNAPVRDGSRLKIVELDFEKMVTSPTFERQLDQQLSIIMAPSVSVEELRWAFDGIPGVVMPTEREVTIEFLPPVEQPKQTPAPQTRREAPPDTEIYLASLAIRGDRVEIGRPENISKNPGYDNQPSFTRDGRSILFTSVRGGGTQTDIYKYDIDTSTIVQITNSPESEYSPTIAPDGSMSVVRVEADSTQRLWRFTADGRNPRLVLDGLKPVGYHAWADEHTVALFVLGAEGQPATLHLADDRTGASRVVATDIGRSLKLMPDGRTISFVQRERSTAAMTLTIAALDPSTGRTTPLVRMPEGATEADCAWTRDGLLLVAYRDHLLGWRRGWTALRDVMSLDALGLHGVSRLAVSPTGDRIAIVASPAAAAHQ